METEQSINRYFFHGTQSPIHLSDHPYLEPALATGLDEGDPSIPHVFLTPNLLLARIFTAKTKSLCVVSATTAFAFAVYTRRPAFHSIGYVYRFTQSDHPHLLETTARGRPTGNWVSFQRLDTRSSLHQTVDGVDELMTKYHVQIYYLTDSREIAQVSKALTDAAYRGERAQLVTLSQYVRSGRVEHLNAIVDKQPIRLV